MPTELVNSTSDKQPRNGVGLCLSGGGYRAMLFHLGSLWRLYEADLLEKMNRISSVSGGSITAGQLGVMWNSLAHEGAALQDDFVPKVVKPIRELARHTIDAWSIGGGIFLPGSISDYVANAYRKHLYGNKSLQDLPDSPRFVFNATNLQSGVLCRFSKPYLRDYRVGKIPNPKTELALAVTASSAFPPVLSPCVIDVDPTDFEANTGLDLQHEPYTNELHLTDGGVYDNLGLETVWKNYKTVLVSDAGGLMAPEEEPEHDWVRQSKRVLEVIDNQVRSLRKRQLIGAFKNNERSGCYWGIRTNISDYGFPTSGSNNAISAPYERTIQLAELPTRLKKTPEATQEKLINWGYAVCDAAIRKHWKPDIPKGNIPYPATGL